MSPVYQPPAASGAASSLALTGVHRIGPKSYSNCLLSEVNQTIGAGANAGFFTRIEWPETGTIDRIAIFCTATGSGNVDIGVYDTTVTTRNRLVSTGAAALTLGWFSGTVSLAVTQGDSVDLAYSCSSGTSTMIGDAVSNGNIPVMPSGWVVVPLGGKNQMSYFVSAVHPLPSTVSEASFNADGQYPLIAFRYA